jgi:two-component system, chemotaxis family, response regulator Rcp1
MTSPIDILLVEDSPSDRYLAVEALSEAEILNNVHLVEDGIKALDFLRFKGQYSQVPRPDIILLDLHLPRKDGWEVLAELKVDPDLRTIPVIILAGSGGNTKEARHAYPQHAQTYITKPIDLKQFNEIIRIYRDLWFPGVTLSSHAEVDQAAMTRSPTRQSEASPIPPKEDRGIWPKVSDWSSLLALNPDEALVLMDAQSHILWINEAFAEMCGYSLQEVSGRKIGSFLLGSQIDPVAQTRIRTAVVGGRSCAEELVKLHKDGHPYRVRLMINPLSGPDGVVRGFLAIEQKVPNKELLPLASNRHEGSDDGAKTEKGRSSLSHKAHGR